MELLLGTRPTVLKSKLLQPFGMHLNDLHDAMFGDLKGRLVFLREVVQVFELNNLAGLREEAVHEALRGVRDIEQGRQIEEGQTVKHAAFENEGQLARIQIQSVVRASAT